MKAHPLQSTSLLAPAATPAGSGSGPARPPGLTAQRIVAAVVLVILVHFLGRPADAAAEHRLAEYRSGQMDPRVRSVPAQVQQGVFSDPKGYLGPLVQSLTGGVADDALKVKILHDWLADQIDYDCGAYFSGAPISGDWTETLRRRKSVCYGYASALTRMCELAGIRAVTIQGYGRGYGYLNGTGDTPGQVNHAWNAVALRGAWHLLDVTWDAGHVEGRSYVKHYGTTYLFLEPQQFIYTHFPGEAPWQLLEKPFSAAEFSGLPYLPGAFFDYGLRLRTALARVNAAGESALFGLEAPDGVSLSVRLKSSSGQVIPQRTLVVRDVDQSRVLTAFPQAGRWTAQLYAKHRGEPGELGLVASLDFDAHGGTSSFFPMTYSAYDDLGGCLYSPQWLPLDDRQPVLFQIRLRQPTDVFLAIGSGAWRKLQPQSADRNVHEIRASVSRGQGVKLVAPDPLRPGQFTVLVEFR
jgi:hypothetical protein